MKAQYLIVLLALLKRTDALKVKSQFIAGFDFDPEEQQAIELDQEESQEAEIAEKADGGEPDLDLCSEVDLGDPFEEYQHGDAQYDSGSGSPDQQAPKNTACLLRKSNKKPGNDQLLKTEALDKAKKEADKDKRKYREMILEQEASKEDQRLKEAKAQKQKAIALQKQKEAEEVEKKKNHKENLANKVKLAEKVKLKAIAEAENAKKEYLGLLGTEKKTQEKKDEKVKQNDQKVKKEAKKEAPKVQVEKLTQKVAKLTSKIEHTKEEIKKEKLEKKKATEKNESKKKAMAKVETREIVDELKDKAMANNINTQLEDLQEAPAPLSELEIQNALDQLEAAGV